MDEKIIEQLKEIVGKKNYSTKVADLYVYSSDASIHQSMPEIVLIPKKIEHVQKIMKIANKNKIPVTPRGAGTSLAGNAVPVKGGIVLDMKGMNRILEIRIDDLYCKVESGVVNDELNKELEKFGFFFPPTPASGNVATIGGMIGNNASGMRAGKYGATRETVIGLKVVLANGELIDIGTKTMKSSSGYQLEKLFIGSEGTLGIIVEATLKILPLPQSRAIAVASFETLEKAGMAVANIFKNGLVPSAVEIMDRVCIEAVNNATNAGLPECSALLLIEADGHPLAVKDEIEKLANICRDTDSTSVEFATEQKRMDELLKSRKAILPSLSRYGSDFVSMSLADDMCVPISKVPNAVKAFQEIAKKYGIIVGTYGHVDTGNLHTKVLFDPTTREAWEKAKKGIDEIYEVVKNLGGTTSGEHGIALTKAPYMKKEKKNCLFVMRAIKKALDPNNILNPGKIFDAPNDWLDATELRYPMEE